MLRAPPSAGMAKGTVALVFCPDSRKARTMSTPDMSEASGTSGSEWAMRRPRLSTT